MIHANSLSYPSLAGNRVQQKRYTVRDPLAMSDQFGVAAVRERGVRAALLRAQPSLTKSFSVARAALGFYDRS